MVQNLMDLLKKAALNHVNNINILHYKMEMVNKDGVVVIVILIT